MEDFDPYDDTMCNDLLEVNSAEVSWDLYDGSIAKTAKKYNLPDGEWRVKWKHGTISFGGHKDNEQDGRNRAAFFIYLYQKGVDCRLSRDLVVCYYKNTIKV